jgi:hypothetical protein
MTENRNTAHNKKYMIISVTVLIAEFTARNIGLVARKESSPQSLTAYSLSRFAS